jgi:tetratricopeptide (TPR) repeat protein
MRSTRLSTLAVALILMSALSVEAAKDDKPIVVYFSYLPTYPPLPDTDQAYFDDVIAAVNNNLSDFELELQEESGRQIQSPLQPLLDLAFSISMNRKNEIQWYATTYLYNQTWMGNSYNSMPSLKQLDDISPVLIQDYNPTDAFDTHFRYAFDDQVSRQVFIDYLTGLTLYVKGDCSHANPYFVQVQEIHALPTNLIPATLFYQGNCGILSGDLESAADYYKNGLKYRNPGDLNDLRSAFKSNFALQANLAWVYMAQGHKDEALKLYDHMTEASDSFTDLSIKIYPYLLRTQLLASFANYQDAIDSAGETIELAPPDQFYDRTLMYLYTLRGKMYLAQYEWDSALADYNKAIELDPTYADAYYERGVLYYSILQTGVELRAEAFDDFHRYLELAPDGDHAADAARYTAQIEKELEALNG